MPKIAKELSPLAVKRLKHPGSTGNAAFAVGGVAGIMLQITPGGGRSWSSSPTAACHTSARSTVGRPRPPLFPPHRRAAFQDAVLREILQERVAARCGRRHLRAVKRTLSGFPLRKRGGPTPPSFSLVDAILIVK